MRIGIDILGGDFAPEANLDGVFMALSELPEDVVIVLIGDESVIKSKLSEVQVDHSRVEIIHADENITMHDHPTTVIRQKQNSSISIGLSCLCKGKLDAFASTGNTGAMLVGAMYILNASPGVIRPCITSTLPTLDDNKTVLLDVGSNADCKPDVLYQFGVLGSVYSEYVYDVKNPRVALLNIGEEPTKGNSVSIEAHKLLSESNEINFVGNIESRDLFLGKADVIVCDGFTGNIVLKEAEGIYYLLKKRGIKDSYFDKFNYENYGGTPVLGVKGNVIIGHGVSNAKAIKNMLIHSYEVAKSGLSNKINEAFK
mgnify:FL=1|tara:strand:+ start:425 stop:1363 length:939 start_codon:yes stop_codon:yes gene_type:complete